MRSDLLTSILSDLNGSSADIEASSVISMADAIVERLEALGFFKEGCIGKRFDHTLDPNEVERLAKSLAKERGYPEALALVTTPME